MTSKIFFAFVVAVSAAPAVAQSAPATPQPLSRTAFMQRIDGAFTSVDTNKDGFTDRAEIEAAEAKALAARKARALKEMDQMFQLFCVQVQECPLPCP